MELGLNYLSNNCENSTYGWTDQDFIEEQDSNLDSIAVSPFKNRIRDEQTSLEKNTQKTDGESEKGETWQALQSKLPSESIVNHMFKWLS